MQPAHSAEVTDGSSLKQQQAKAGWGSTLSHIHSPSCDRCLISVETALMQKLDAAEA